MSKSNIKKYYSIRSFFTYLGAFKLRMFIVGFSFVLANVLVVIIPVFIGKLVGALAGQPLDSHQIWMYVIILIACSSGHDLLWRTSEFLYLKLLNPVVIAYENVLFQQTIHKPYPYFVDKFTGKISSYITTIGQETRDFAEKIFWDYLDQVITLISVIAILTSVNWQTGAIFTAGLLLMLITGRFTILNSVRYEKKWTDVQSTKNGKIIDAVANFVNVKSFQKEMAETRLVRAEQQNNIAAANQSFLWGIVFWGSMSFIIRNMIWPATIAFNVWLFLDHQISLGDVATVLSAILIFSTSIWDIIWDISQFSLKLARIEEAHTYLFGSKNIMRAQLQQDNLAVVPEYAHSFALEHVTFAYPDKPEVAVLHDISLQLRKGEKLGIVGRSGGGKTTLTKLLLDYYQVDTGVLLDGRPIDTARVAQLVSYVPQDTSLFHRSIAENIAYAATRDVSRQDIVHAAKQAHADEFITGITGGYDALVGERGVKLSAGQRQRIAIARAFLDDKPILILDEATSALDSESEILVQEALEALWHDKTVIAIAHRLSTLRHMDRIIVIDKGEIVEQGTHTELVSAGGTYAKLWSHQSGGFIED